MNVHTLQKVPPAVRAVLTLIDPNDEVDGTLDSCTCVAQVGLLYQFNIERAPSNLSDDLCGIGSLRTLLNLSHWPDAQNGSELWAGSGEALLLAVDLEHRADHGNGGLVDGTLSVLVAESAAAAQAHAALWANQFREQCLRDLCEPLLAGIERFTPQVLAAQLPVLIGKAAPASYGRFLRTLCWVCLRESARCLWHGLQSSLQSAPVVKTARTLTE